MTTCNHPRCELPVPSDQYACRTHWFSLPKMTRDDIWRGYHKDHKTVWLRGHKSAQKYWGKVQERQVSNDV